MHMTYAFHAHLRAIGFTRIADLIAFARGDWQLCSDNRGAAAAVFALSLFSTTCELSCFILCFKMAHKSENDAFLRWLIV